MATSDFKHDPTELVILAVLSEESLYGYAITKRVVGRSAGEIKMSPGVLYPLLSSMERQGLITSTWETVRSERTGAADQEGATEDGGDGGGGNGGGGGRKRKWYKLSAKGRKRLEQHVQAHRAYQAMIEGFITPAPAAREQRS